MKVAIDWSEAGIMQANRLLGLDGGNLEALRESAAILRESEQLRQRLSQCLYELPDDPSDADGFAAAAAALPKLVEAHAAGIREAMGSHARMFPVWLIAGMLPWTAACYRARGIPDEILEDTMVDLSIWMNATFAQHGEHGLDNLGWLLHHASGRLFRLGRLQFMHKTFDHPVIALRSRRSGEVALLSEAGIIYRRDGRIEGTNGVFDGEASWQAEFHRTEEGYLGHPIAADGTAVRDTALLPAEEWTVELHRGDPVLDMHIPEGGPMQPEQCRESFGRAVRFFADRFPDKPFRALVCTSWLLDAQLAGILPASSNIAAFQRELHLYPVRSNEEETYRRVFGTSRIDPRTASRATKLQRAIADYAEAGGLLHAAGGLLLLADAVRPAVSSSPAISPGPPGTPAE